MDFYEKLEQARTAAPPSTAKGIRAMILMPEGYTSREIGEQMNVSDKHSYLGGYCAMLCQTWLWNGEKLL